MIKPLFGAFYIGIVFRVVRIDTICLTCYDLMKPAFQPDVFDPVNLWLESQLTKPTYL